MTCFLRRSFTQRPLFFEFPPNGADLTFVGLPTFLCPRVRSLGELARWSIRLDAGLSTQNCYPDVPSRKTLHRPNRRHPHPRAASNGPSYFLAMAAVIAFRPTPASRTFPARAES